MPQHSDKQIVLHEGLPLYYMEAEGSLVDFVAFVQRPAIKRGFLAFSEQTPKPMQFTVTSEERRIVSGPLMLADTPIYRIDEETGEEYYVSFPAKTIENIAKDFARYGFHKNVNEMHDKAKRRDGVFMFETFISDPARGIAPMKGYEDAKPGSLFASYFVENDEVWEKVKTGEFTGFSVEGLFSPAPAVEPEEESNTEQDFDADTKAVLLEIMGMIP